MLLLLLFVTSSYALSCVDENTKDCAAWAGYCAVNANVREHCPVTCGTNCQSNAGGDCADISLWQDCAWWYSEGYCTDPDYSEAMMHWCPRTCGCGKVVPRYLAKRSTGPLVKRAVTCVDHSDACKGWTTYCASNSNVRDHCPVSCKVCDDGSDNNEDTDTDTDEDTDDENEDGLCVDKNTGCPSWTDYCSTNGNVRDQCPVTCNTCPEDRACEDLNTDGQCTGWVVAGHCTSDQYRIQMKSLCYKSCGYCGDRHDDDSEGTDASDEEGNNTDNADVDTDDADKKGSEDDSNSSTSFSEEMLTAHNTYRAAHNAPLMSWNATVAAWAQDWCSHLAVRLTPFEHSEGSGYGENLMKVHHMKYSDTSSGTQAVERWYSEIKDYDYSNPGYSAATGHFTQVIWKESTVLGCGQATSASDLKGWLTYICCNYSPAGNLQGEYVDNVPHKRIDGW